MCWMPTTKFSSRKEASTYFECDKNFIFNWMFLSHWSKCVHIVVNLINKILSKIINNITLYQKLYNQVYGFSFLRSFGCLHFSSTLTINRTKFYPRAKSCILIGYPLGMKAYKLLDLTTRSIFISRDVTFMKVFFLSFTLHKKYLLILFLWGLKR